MATDFNTHHLSVNELTAHNINAPTMDHNDNKSLDSPLIDNDLNDLERGIDDYLNDDFRLNYSLNKIVLVNSASHAYSEIPIDEPLVLLGKNNRGKTSSLAATKLILYPEVNFNNCESKFNFTNKANDPYSKEESYKHYFPISESFIAVEVKNHAGLFTMLLYRVGDYKYHRLFFPVPYEEIKPFIWNEQTNYFADELGIKSLIEVQKKLGGLHLTTKQELQNVMYGNRGSKTSHFCVVPIKDQKEASIRSFVKIYELAFDAGKDEKKKLPNAIATIIEMQRGRDKEKLNENVHDLKIERAQLFEESLKIKSLTENKDDYEFIQKQFDALHLDAKHAVLEYTAFLREFKLKQQQYAKDKIAIGARKEDIERERNHAIEEVKQVANEITRLGTLHKALKEEVAQLQQQKIKAEKILGQFSHKSPQDIIAEMTIQRHRYDETFKAMQAKENTVILIQQKNKQKQDLEAKIKAAQNGLDNHDLLLANQLPSHSAHILGSINEDFLNITANSPLTEEALRQISDFTALFTVDDANHLSFLSFTLPNTFYHPYDADKQRSQFEKTITQDKKEASTLSQEIGELNSALSQFDTDIGKKIAEGKKQALKEQIVELDAKITLLEGLSLIKSQIEDKTQQISQKEKALAEAQDLRAIKDQSKASTDSKYNQIVEQFDDIISFGKEAESITSLLAGVRKSQGLPYLAEDDPEITSCLENNDIEINLNAASTIANSIGGLSERINRLVSKVSDFTEVVLVEGINPHQRIEGINSLGEVIQQYKNSFDTLEFQKSNYHDKIKTHNSVIDNLLKEITDSAGLLRTTISSLNKKLNEHKISNLHQVSLKLNLAPDFANLERTYAKHNANQTSLLDERFYESLINYVEKTSHSNSQRLKMRNLIDSIDYEYTQATGEIEQKSQSGGTTSTITALIATLLFSEAFQKGSSLRMPIIVDEVGTIDKDNIKTIVEHVSNAGFTIICANPGLHADTLRYIPNYIRVDKSLLDGKPKSRDCIFHIMPSQINRQGRVVHGH